VEAESRARALVVVGRALVALLVASTMPSPQIDGTPVDASVVIVVVSGAVVTVLPSVTTGLSVSMPVDVGVVVVVSLVGAPVVTSLVGPPGVPVVVVAPAESVVVGSVNHGLVSRHPAITATATTPATLPPVRISSLCT
jgi:hypothetical protein